MNDKHTPIPWEALVFDEDQIVILGPRDAMNRRNTVGVLFSAQRRADAALIIEACNAYNTLRSELEKVKAENERLKARFTVPIVCMCGSTRFEQTWTSENSRLTQEGNIVLSVGLCAHAEGVMERLESTGMKVKLDDLHKRKIDLCDWVWILDVDGYIGNSTRSEIEYAEKQGKPVRYLSKEFPDYKEPQDPIKRLESALAAEKAENERITGLYKTMCKDRADEDTEIKKLASPYFLAHELYGDAEYGVPTIFDVAEMLVDKLAAEKNETLTYYDRCRELAQELLGMESNYNHEKAAREKAEAELELTQDAIAEAFDGNQTDYEVYYAAYDRLKAERKGGKREK